MEAMVVSRRRARELVLAGLAGLTALVAFLGAVAVNAASARYGPWPGWLDLLRTQPFRASALLAVIAVVAAVSAVWRQERLPKDGGYPAPPSLRLPPVWLVDRPTEVDSIVRALRRRGGRSTVAVTTALHGAGGFGKTTVAEVVCADRRVRRLLRGRIYWITLGRDAIGQTAIISKVNDLVRVVAGASPGIDDLELAAQYLGRVLDHRGRLLLVIDDVWTADQLEPFLVGGRRCTRLVTTRVPSALPSSAAAVAVDEMSPTQALAVLTRDLPELDPALVEELQAVAGRWPLLLRVVNRTIVTVAATGLAAGEAAQ
jgi:hypothetical protein